ncbi:hypothetical protein CHS0354_016448 [Potamilus streckersoni]|uniref:Uncharacterized protein n=1 Tax=Potamilus streckersoni TaxID=2493646 RepID=A0AAE0TJP3_9BIVA|nr:hypothetical protein CHS0354_016448 [Potamilus streckersoni]
MERKNTIDQKLTQNETRPPVNVILKTHEDIPRSLRIYQVCIIPSQERCQELPSDSSLMKAFVTPSMNISLKLVTKISMFLVHEV